MILKSKKMLVHNHLMKLFLALIYPLIVSLLMKEPVKTNLVWMREELMKLRKTILTWRQEKTMRLLKTNLPWRQEELMKLLKTNLTQRQKELLKIFREIVDQFVQIAVKRDVACAQRTVHTIFKALK